MIYQIKRDNIVIFQHEIRGARTQSAPAVDFVDIEFDYYEAILLERNDTIEFDGQIYYCDKQYANYQKKSNNLYNHRARFLSENYRATEIVLLDPNGFSSFEIEGNLLTLLTLAVDNLNRVSSGWSYVTPPTTVTKTFDVSGENVMSFLTKLSGEFEIPFDISNKVIEFKAPDLPNKGDFAYGKGNGFLDLRRSCKTTDKVPNKVYATGGDGLQLDDPVWDVNDSNFNGIIEGFYSNEDIKPTTRAQMVGTTSFNNVVVTDLINYNLNNYIIPGTTPIINFETGALGGLSFYITQFTYNPITNVSLIYIKHRTVDGTMLPDNTVRPQHGDYFNITNITQPSEVVDEAIGRLQTAAYAYMANGIKNNIKLEASLDPLYIEDLKLNDLIKVKDDDLEIDDDFVIVEIKTDLQNLQKKDLVLNYLPRSLTGFRLRLKNDNIIDLGIANNHDDLVTVQDKIGVIGGQIDDIEQTQLPILAGQIGTVSNELAEVEDDVENIVSAFLPLKEDESNKKQDLTSTNANHYPSVPAVKQGLATKQNILTQGSNIDIVGDTISVKVNGTTSGSTYAVQNDPNGNLVVNVPIVDGVTFHQIPTTAPLNIQITTKKTIINVATGVTSANITVGDGLHDGYELAINGCDEWSINLIGNVQDSCGDQGSFSLSQSSLFWWSVANGMWIQAI